jgi:DNA-binding GntR family transcriptional regulator
MANQLHKALAAKILRYIRTNGFQPGHHLTEASLQHVLGTSRGPIRAALGQLTADGFVHQSPNRGYFLVDVGTSTNETVTDQDISNEDDAIYLAIAHGRLTGEIPETVSELDLMRRLGLSRLKLRRILLRIAAEGWIERREGRGWSFIQLIDSVEAYRESYALRQMIEPAGLIGETFKMDLVLLKQLRMQQTLVLDGGWKTLSQIELFETNAHFHAGLASMSGNRFVLSSIERQNQLRRLVEYRQILNREQVRGQNEEHLEILLALERGQIKEASRLLSDHLGNAKNQKARNAIFSG